jgi:hypothetical protein
VETLQDIQESTAAKAAKSEAAAKAAKAKRPIEDFRKNECRSVRRLLPHGLRYSYYGVVLVFLL